MAGEGMKRDIGLSWPDPKPAEVNWEVFPSF